MVSAWFGKKRQVFLYLEYFDQVAMVIVCSHVQFYLLLFDSEIFWFIIE